MGALFHSFIYQPVYNILIFLYEALPWSDFGLAIVLTTALIKTLFLPLSQKQITSQKKMQEIQPKLKEIQEKYKGDKEKQTKAMMECYKENKVNPFAGCLPLIIQIVFFIAIYRVIITLAQAGLVANPNDLYSFVKNPETIHPIAFGFLNLLEKSYWLAALAALVQYFQTKMLMPSRPVAEKKEGEVDMMGMMNKQMLYLGPGLTFVIGITFPAALTLYWFVSTLLSWAQQKWIFSRHH
ncbi:MAG: YidC/Oxa1 family membrane protein insertase [Candidatus Moraniibacteriota bacterium]